MNEYEKQAKDFCEKYNVKIISTYIGHGKHFEDDKTPRAIYSITIVRDGKTPYTFQFSQSLVNSYKGINLDKNFSKVEKLPQSFPYGKFKMPVKFGERLTYSWKSYGKYYRYIITQADSSPNEYDILTCLTKYDPSTFENFCNEFGYDIDSRKAEKTYFAVVNDWENVERLFSDCLDELQEIN